MRKLFKVMKWLLGLNHRKLLELLDWTLRLKVPIVVVYSGPEDLNRLAIGLDAAKHVQEFYRRTCGIELQVTVEGDSAPRWGIGPTYPQEVLLQHRFEYGALPFLVLLRSDTGRVGNGYLGEAFGGAGGFCVVAGNQPPGPVQASQILVHELGHLLGLGHEEGTFMRAALETDKRIVTKEQRAKVRETAYQFGGL